jgi:ATP-dependent Clp protease ATP-binding subunit ClpB
MPIHFAIALFQDEDKLLKSVIDRAGGDSSQAERRCKSLLVRLPSQTPAPEALSMSSKALKVLNAADDLRKQQRDSHLAIDHVILAVSEDDDISKAFQEAGVQKKALLNAINHVRGTRKVDSKSADSTYEALSKYAIDLVAMAEQGKLDPVIGRDDEIRRVIRVLARRTKNNPVLIGEPGVGKTAIVEGLAQRILRKDVPANLQCKLFSLDMGACKFELKQFIL